MKSLIAISLVTASISVSAFAQSSQSAQPANPAAQTQSSNTASADQWTPPYGQQVKPLTRAQVYQQLIHAEKDGQLEYLNSTLYRGA
jgi:hypothetical protein